MIEPKQMFEDFQKNVQELMAKSPAADIEKNVKALMAQAFTKMDLATREEVDILREMVQQLRERIEVLEAKVDALNKGE